MDQDIQHIIKNHQQMTYQTCLGFIGQEEAKDLMQEVCINFDLTSLCKQPIYGGGIWEFPDFRNTIYRYGDLIDTIKILCKN